MEITNNHSIEEHDKALETLTELSSSPEEEAFENIPVEFHPAINHVAAEIASALGYEYPDDYDFLNPVSPRAVEMRQLAIVSISTLQHFCLTEWGTSLSELADNDDTECPHCGFVHKPGQNTLCPDGRTFPEIIEL